MQGQACGQTAHVDGIDDVVHQHQRRHHLHVDLWATAVGVLFFDPLGAGLPLFPLTASPPPRDTHLSWAKKVMFKKAKQGYIGTPGHGPPAVVLRAGGSPMMLPRGIGRLHPDGGAHGANAAVSLPCGFVVFCSGWREA